MNYATTGTNFDLYNNIKEGQCYYGSNIGSGWA